VKEVWKDISGYEGFYQVSNLGRVKSLARTAIRGGRPYRIKEKILSPYIGAWGYRIANFKKGDGHHWHRVSVLVAKEFVSNPDKLPVVNHKDRVRTNDVPHNLEWTTDRENATHGQLLRKQKSSKFTGVCWDKSISRWVARIRIGDKRIRLGSFNNEEDASKEYKKAMNENGITNKYAQVA